MRAAAQGRVQALLDALVASGTERGLQVAAYVDGELAVDAWAGVADPASGRAVDGDTLFVVFSATKGIIATAIHLLVDRGKLAYDAPVARYWPEFGVRGKRAITLRHVLAHTAGVPQMPVGVTADDLTDWEGMCAAIADLVPLWPPGECTAYHAQTMGWILGEVARRADGRPIAQLVREEICAPLGITSLHLGLPRADAPLVATLEDWPPGHDDRPGRAIAGRLARVARERRVWQTILGRLRGASGRGERCGSVRRLAEPAPVAPSAAVYNRPDIRAAVLPASGGIMNARALARHYAALTGEGVNGVRLLTPERVRLATAPHTTGPDAVLEATIPRGLGYWLGGSASPLGPWPSAFGHPGAGGSVGFADPRHRLAFALTRNRLASGGMEEATALVAVEVRAALGIPLDASPR